MEQSSLSAPSINSQSENNQLANDENTSVEDESNKQETDSQIQNNSIVSEQQNEEFYLDLDNEDENQIYSNEQDYYQEITNV